MKIIGGKYRGRNFFMPREVRPTQNVVRKAVFDILGQDLEGVYFLDLFAGSGAVGLEALSRGAEMVAFVEKDPRYYATIQENISLLPMKADKKGRYPYEVINADALATVKRLHERQRRYDVVFLDPPYGRGLAKKTLKTLGAYDILHDNCTVIIEHEKREILPEREGRFLTFRQKRYGNAYLTIYRSQESAEHEAKEDLAINLP